MSPHQRFFSRTLPISFLLLAILFKFQNCAGPQSSDFASTGATDGSGGEVRIVDRWQEQKVAFLSDTQFIANPTEATIQGLCVGGAAPEPIAYEVIHTAGDTPRVEKSGTVDCHMGNFEIAIPDLPFENCNDSYTVRASRLSGEGGEAITSVRPSCDEG